MKVFSRALRLMLLAVFLVPTGAAWGQTVAQQAAFDGGLAAFGRGEYDAALTAWQPLADEGMAAAQLGLGVLYFDGLGVGQDDTLAARWFSLAAEAGNAEAQFNLGRMYFTGRGLVRDNGQARRWYEQASDAGHAEASYQLGSLYASGSGVDRDELLAFHRFDLAVALAEDGRVRLLAESNRSLLERRLSAQQIGQAKAMTAKTLEGVAGLKAAAAGSYDDGLAAFNEQDYDGALTAWRPAAERGDARAQLGLAVIFHDGLGVDQDLGAAAQWFRRAADQGLAEAQFNLGVLFYSGRGVTADPAEAARWYTLAGDQGHAEANYYLGTMYVAGLGVAQDNLAAYRHFSLAVEQSGTGGETALTRLAVQGRESATRRLSPREVAALEGAPAEGAAVEAVPDEAVPGSDEPKTGDRVASLTVAELEAAAGEAREAQSRADEAAARLAELEELDTRNSVDGAETAMQAAAEQLAEVDRQAEDERAAQTQASQALEKAEASAEDAGRLLEARRRALAAAQKQGEGIAEELAELEARRQAALRRQTAAQAQVEAVKDKVEEQTAALAAEGELADRAEQALEESRARSALLDQERAAAVRQQQAAAEALRRSVAAKEKSRAEIEAARAALAEANQAASAARNRLNAATLVFNQASGAGAPAPDESAPAAPEVEQGRGEVPVEAPKELVARVQRSLASLGYDPGQADGVAGERTLSALRQFQADNGLPPTGTVTEELAFILDIIASARGAPVQRELSLGGSGTGFVIAGDGHVLTNHHVVQGCTEVRVQYGGETYVAPHLASDISNDLALLNTAIQTDDFLAFRAGRAIRPGDDVVVMGFPLQGQLSDQVKVTKGTISALSGPSNDRTLLQTTAPVQAGSSGGPLLDLSGNIVGVVMGKISAVEVENVSFGIKSAIARIFLDAEGVNYRSTPSEEARSAADVAEFGRRFTVLVECWNE